MTSSSPEQRQQASTLCSELSRKVECQFLDFVIFTLKWSLFPSISMFLALFSIVMMAYEEQVD